MLFVLPRALQRYRLPSAISCVALGAVAGMGLGLFTHDPTINLLSTLGIVSLFLFAGLDVEFSELRRNAPVLLQHIAIRLTLLGAVTLGAAWLLRLPLQPALLVALALTTPSTGFILDSLGSLGVNDHERAWIKSTAIATELVALLILFVALQPPGLLRRLESTFMLGAMVVLLPMLFRLFAAVVLPYAPKSEFGFLLMAAVLCAVITRQLGAYYLVGAFVVGVTAQRFRRQLPAIASGQMVHAVEVFASFFVPFYFFHAGLALRREDFSVGALVLGGAFLLLVPVRVWFVALHRRVVLGESMASGARIGLSIVPTLVFTLVLAEILRDRFAVPQALFGGLMIYTLGNTLLPGFLLRVPAGRTSEDMTVAEMALVDPGHAPESAGGDVPVAEQQR